MSKYRFMAIPELARQMALSETAIRALRKWGAPFIAKKSHPQLLLDWLARNADKVRKIE